MLETIQVAFETLDKERTYQAAVEYVRAVAESDNWNQANEYMATALQVPLAPHIMYFLHGAATFIAAVVRIKG